MTADRERDTRFRGLIGGFALGVGGGVVSGKTVEYVTDIHGTPPWMKGWQYWHAAIPEVILAALVKDWRLRGALLGLGFGHILAAKLKMPRLIQAIPRRYGTAPLAARTGWTKRWKIPKDLEEEKKYEYLAGKMAEGIWAAKQDPGFRDFVVSVIRQYNVDFQDRYHVAAAWRDWIRHNIIYVHDPTGVEWFYYPTYVANYFVENGYAYEDCDGQAMLFTAGMGAVGFPAVLMFMSRDPKAPSTYTHVLGAVVGEHGELVPAETIVDDYPFGTWPDRMTGHMVVLLDTGDGKVHTEAHEGPVDSEMFTRGRKAAPLRPALNVRSGPGR